jgi:CubicO group peptidase (beta-lactamase class C family)
VFDLASVTKLFTATVVLHLVEQGRLGLDEPVAHHLEEYAGPSPRAAVTVRQLLTHTSGLPAEAALWRAPDLLARRAALLGQELQAPPGRQFCYSCLGYLTLGVLAERVLGRPLDRLVEELVAAPLGLRDTGYRPLSGQQRTGRRDAIAATELRRVGWSPEHDPEDPDVRGVVHDENAASFGGVAGNAGLFAPARDLLGYGRAVLAALGTDDVTALGLSRQTVRELVTPQLPTGLAPGFQSGLGFRIDDASFMGGLVGSGRSYGHTGFTGTSLVLDERRNLVVVLLTNRVHPSRDSADLNPLRRRLADLLAEHHATGVGG